MLKVVSSIDVLGHTGIIDWGWRSRNSSPISQSEGFHDRFFYSPPGNSATSTATLQRIEAKDYRDIAAMVASGISVSRGLAGARQLFGTHFQPSESLKAMVYFEGGDLHLLMHEERMLLIEAASAVRDLPEVQIASTELALRSA